MDSKLRVQLKSNLGGFSELTWQAKYNDPRVVLNYIKDKCNVSLKSIWNNIEANLVNLQNNAAKDIVTSRAVFDEATFILQQLKIKQDTISKKYEQQQLKKALELIDEAIINCPSTSSTAQLSLSSIPCITLSEVYALRCKALLKYGQGELALVAIKEALRLAPNSLYNYSILVKTLVKHLKRPKEALMHIRSALELADYPPSAEKATSTVNSLPHYTFTAEFVANLRKLEASILDELDEDNYNSLEMEENKASSFDKQPKSEKKVKNFSMDYRCQIGGSPVMGKGRFFAATGSIPSGTTIFLEHAYSLVILQEKITSICAFCFRNVVNCFVPCNKCTDTVYCSADCAHLHNTSGHQFGCRLNKYMSDRSKSTTSVFHMLNRTGIQSVLKAIESSKEWKKVGEINEEDSKDENDDDVYDVLAYSKDIRQRFTADVAKDDQLRLQQYQAQMTLYSHYEKYSGVYLYSTITNAIECAIIASIAQGFTFEHLSNENEQLVKLIIHCFISIRRVLTNGFRWSSHDEVSGERVHNATCYNLIGSLFNHACNPNAEWAIHSGVLSIVTVREVKSGEELTISYGPTVDEAFEERQKRLREGYFFQCNCSQCIKDCQNETVLKCSSCTGPVLNSTCLACSQVMSNADEKVHLLQGAITDLEIKTKLMTTVCKSAIDEDKDYASLRNSLKTIIELIFSPSNKLFECLYKASRFFYQKGNLEECIVFGELVDCLMPMKTSDLLVIFNHLPHTKSTENSSTAVDINLDHLIFWCSVYGMWIEHTGSIDEAVWSKLLRFNARLKKLLKSVLMSKESRLSDLKDKDKAINELVVVRQEVHTLNELKLYKAQQLTTLKVKFIQQLDFDKLEAESLGV